jgi:hypothetical protein
MSDLGSYKMACTWPRIHACRTPEFPFARELVPIKGSKGYAKFEPQADS